MADEATVQERFRPRFRAKLRYARISPMKLRKVVDLIRGKGYNQAVAILRACPRAPCFSLWFSLPCGSLPRLPVPALIRHVPCRRPPRGSRAPAPEPRRGGRRGP